MNKFAIATILLGLAAIASADPVPKAVRSLEDSEFYDEISEFKIKPDDDGESAFLSENHGILRDFCSRSRDRVYSYIQGKNREAISNVFAIFFGSMVEVTEQLETIQKSEADRATQIIRDGLAPLPEGEQITEEKAEERIKESVGLLRSIGSAMSSYVRALGEATMKELMVRLNLLKQTITNTENLKEIITDTCSNIQLELQKELQAMLRDSKAEILKSDPSEETKTALASATFENVGCLTISRTRKVGKICGVFNAAGPMIFTMMGI